MNIRDLEYLRALATHGSFKRAAAAIPISQPTLSIQIAKLERYLGVALLERGKRSVTLTDVGSQVLARAAVILNAAAEIEQLAEAAKDPEIGTLKLGIFPTLAPYLLPHVIDPLLHRFPQLSVLFHEKKSSELIAMLHHRTVDAVVLSETEKLDEFNTIPLFSEPLLVAVPQKNKLATKKFLTIRELASSKLLLLEDGHCLRDQVVNLCETAKVGMQLDFTTTSLETIRQLVAANIGITLMPALATHPRDKAIRYIPFFEPIPKRKICIAFRKDTNKQRVIAAMATVVSEKMRPVLEDWDYAQPHSKKVMKYSNLKFKLD